jgi:hypothetical protein
VPAQNAAHAARSGALELVPVDRLVTALGEL